MGPRAHTAMRYAMARVDTVLKQYEYKPKLQFDANTPEARAWPLQRRRSRRALAGAGGATLRRADAAVRAWRGVCAQYIQEMLHALERDRQQRGASAAQRQAGEL